MFSIKAYMEQSTGIAQLILEPHTNYM